MIVIIQARLGSKRFSEKVLTKIYDKPLIEYILERLKKNKSITKIVVSTTYKKKDNKLVNFLKKKKILTFRGDEDNVASRLLETAVKLKAKYFIRISGDSPMIDNKIISIMVRQFKVLKKVDIFTNVFPRIFPKGQSVEIIKTKILKENLKRMSDFEKEHVTQFFYKNSKKFNIKSLNLNKTKKNFKKLKFAIDTKRDLKNLIKKFKKKDFLEFSYLKKWFTQQL